LILWISVNLSGQSNTQLNFNSVDVTDGLSNNYVNAVAQDALGFIWIGTNDGLNRYDTHESIRVFKSGEIGLESNAIKALYADSLENLWIGTSFGGLVKYNVKSYQSITYNKDPDGDLLLSNNEVLAIEGVGDEIFIGTENGLNVLNPETDSIFQFPTGGEGQLAKSAILSITKDDHGWIWVTTWGHHYYLYLPHPSGRHELGKFRQFKVGTKEASKKIWKVMQDTKDRYWVGTHGDGLFSMHLPLEASHNQGNQQWEPTYQRFYHDPSTMTTISNSYPQDIIKDSSGNIWITTINGLNLIESKNLEQYDFDSSDNDLVITNIDGQNSIPNNQMEDLFVDRQGMIWVGTSGGLILYNQRLNQFDWYFINDNSLDNQTESDLVATMTQVDNDEILIGLQNSGLLTYHIETNDIVKNNPIYNQFDGKRIQCLHFNKKSRKLYVGTMNDLYRVDIDKNQTIKYEIYDHHNQPLTNLVYSGVIEDQSGQIWVGTETGLFSINKDNRAITWYMYDVNDQTSISDNSITQVYEDSTGRIWVSTFNGLNIIKRDKPNVEFERFLRNPNEVNTIPTNQVKCISEYNGKIYFGSTTGIFSIDMETKKSDPMDKYKTKHTVNGMQITNNGILWASTSDGLLRYDINQNQSYLYTKKEGIDNLSFRSFGSIIDANNTFYIGANNKFGIIKDEEPKQYDRKPNLHFTTIKVINADSETTNSLCESKIELPPNNYYLEINFTNLDYSHFDNNQYAYRLLGFEADEDWHYTDNNQVSYTNLENGTYTFEVKGIVGETLQEESGISLDITVKPAFVETIWFKLLILGSLILLFLLGIFIRTSAFRKRNEMLRKYNSNLNAEIEKTASANAALEEREKSMQDLLEKLNRSNQNLQRSNKDLEQFAYVASHDLQEPLNTVGSFTKLLETRLDKDDEMSLKFIDYVTAGVDRMSALIKSILTYSLVSSEDIQLQKTDLKSIIESKVEDLNILIQKKNAKVNIGAIPEIICDGDQMGMVFYNMILNGLKFNKSAEPTINVTSSESETHHIFTIEDNGIGIPQEYQDQIFDIFKRLHGKGEYEGTGIGLSLCSKIIHRHEGKITIDSAVGRGTKFILSVNKSLAESLESALV
jgi:signal transduction histidine kinase/ligand-binding sensor domain-containing protein